MVRRVTCTVFAGALLAAAAACSPGYRVVSERDHSVALVVPADTTDAAKDAIEDYIDTHDIEGPDGPSYMVITAVRKTNAPDRICRSRYFRRPGGRVEVGT